MAAFPAKTFRSRRPKTSPWNSTVRITVSHRANRVEWHVIDDGEGVAKELQAQLFEPFFTTFASGTGLGLYIARELCAANGASLEYLDRSPGADFRILW